MPSLTLVISLRPHSCPISRCWCLSTAQHAWPDLQHCAHLLMAQLEHPEPTEAEPKGEEARRWVQLVLSKEKAMFSSSPKIMKPNSENPDSFKSGISQAFPELEINSDLKTPLRELSFTAAKEIEIGDNEQAIIIFAPIPQLKFFQKIQVWLVCELEKKFKRKHAVFIAQRRILPSKLEKAVQKISKSIPGAIL
uniref:40S ribosomal protein S7 n=1 Tax=Callithrix jacchus TaxID=9483 RepID=A0A8I4A2T2_CALJA